MDFYIENDRLIKCISAEGDIVIPDNIKIIDDNAFFNCQKITSVTFPPNLKKIGFCAFYCCSNLKSISLNDELQDIGTSAFERCISLGNVTLPKKIKYIKKDAFAYCDCIEEFRLDAENKNYVVRDGVVYTKNLDTIVVYPKSKKEKKFVVPKNVEKIKQHTFAWCTNLEEVVLSEGVVSIAKEAFFNCINLRKINFPNSLSMIKATAFDGCDNLSEIYLSTTNEYIANSLYYTHCRVQGPFDEFNLNVKMICQDYQVFSSRKSKYKLTTVCGYIYALENGYEYTDEDKKKFLKYIKTQRKKIFKYIQYEKCILRYLLENKVLDSEDIDTLLNLDFIKEDSELKNEILIYNNREFKPKDDFAEFEKQMKIIDDFSKSRKLPIAEAKKNWTFKKTDDGRSLRINKYKGYDTEVIVPAIIGRTKVTGFNGEVFNDYAKVKSLDIPGTVTFVSPNAFSGMLYLESLVLSEGIKSIEPYAFSFCYKLKDIYIPESLEYIDSGAFRECSSLSGNLDLRNVEYVGNGAFYNSNITSITFSKKLQTIERGAFGSCYNLSGEIVFDNDILYINQGAFEDCGIESVIFGDGVKGILAYAFARCHKLKKIVINENINQVSNKSFKNCINLNEVVINCDLNRFQDKAFEGCIAIKKVIIKKAYADNLSKLSVLFGENIQIEYMD